MFSHVGVKNVCMFLRASLDLRALLSLDESDEAFLLTLQTPIINQKNKAAGPPWAVSLAHLWPPPLPPSPKNWHFLSLTQPNVTFFICAQPAAFCSANLGCGYGTDHAQDIKFAKGTTTLAFKVSHHF